MRRSGFVLIAVLVVVGSALLIGTSIIFIAQSEVAGARGTGDSVQSRELAQSGLNIIMHRLNQQRDEILRGEQPTLDRQYAVYERGNRRGVIRLLPIGPERARLVPEAAKLDINEADEDMLAAIEMLNEGHAERIVERRGQNGGGRYQSIHELLKIDGMTSEQVYGPLDELRWMSEAQTALDDNALLSTEGEQPTALADVLTVFAVEPPLQRDGRRRINLNVQWSEELGERLDDRFGPGAGALVRQIIDDGTTFDRDARIVEVLRSADVPVEDWADIFDAVTTHDGEYHFGRMDINTASATALEALPGITPEQAASIVRIREGLGNEERETIVWPVMNDIFSPETFEGIVDHITTRSWTYRVRLAAGEVDADDPDGPLEQPLILEAVVDLAAPAPRIAYLRDVSMVQMAAAINNEARMLADANDSRSFERDEDWFVRDDNTFVDAFADDEDEAESGDDPGTPAWREDVWATMMDEPAEADDEDWWDASFDADEEEADPFERSFFEDDHDAEENDAGGRGQRESPSQRRRIGRWHGG